MRQAIGQVTEDQNRALDMTMVSTRRHSDLCSLHQEGAREADRYKWIESEKRGHDVGWHAVNDWYRKHWLRYCREKRIEHVMGQRRWEEFSDNPSSYVLELIQSNDLLFERVLDRLICDWENLDIIAWGVNWGICTKRIISILEELDINSARFDPPCLD
tara:strand:- start:499 stop:975 length:477 start_codon:yes stop_codon:yes gene_type:complete